ncbi:MAG TPA: ATP-binding cassette domain-containing protein [Planctomycetes bacterium]|nr:ATP-binding cassette domain-containing protein [Planctomycetota bacterium]HIL38186.1 ATP-binding cassette domain-containing protein [Planctomycetota bacterium]
MNAADLHSLLASQAEGWDQVLEVLAELLPERDFARAHRLLADHRILIEQDRPGALVVLAGSTGAGKSTLFNALCGKELSEVGEMRPTTRQAVVALGPAASRDELPAIADQGQAQLNRLDAPGPMGLADLTLVDAPDLNSYETEGREVLAQWADHADLLLVMVHRQSIVEQAPVQFIADYSRRRRLLLVLGRADELPPQAREELVEQLLRVAREEWGVQNPEVLAVDSLAAMEGRGGEVWQGQADQLRQALAAGALIRIRKDNARGALESVGQDLAPALDEAVELLTQRSSALDRALELWTNGLVRTTRVNLQTHSVEWVELLRQLAGDGWRGPGGWAMRLSGAGSGGLGLGLLLGRRNPLLGLGVAAAGSAIDSLEGAKIKERLDQGIGIWPGAQEEQQVIEVASLEAGLGGDETLCAELSRRGSPAFQAALSAWTATHSSRSWSPQVKLLLRALVDGPLAVLAAFALVRALLGVFGEAGLGMDRLMDSLVVATFWLLIWRWVSGRLLARRAGEERQALVGCLEEALASEAEGIRKSRDDAWKPRQALLEQARQESSKKL